MPLAPYRGNEKCNEVYKDRDGSLWVAMGYIDLPAAILENVKTGELVYEIIGCPNAERWTQLIEKQP
jgi:hypothetical protein